MVKFSLLIKILPFCCIFFSCIRENSESGAESGAESSVPLEIHRMETALFALDTNQLGAGISELRERYPAFFNTWLRNVFGVNPADTAAYQQLRPLLSNRYVRVVAADIDSVYPATEKLGRELGAAFGRYQELFPATPLPAVFTYPASISGFQPAVWNADSLLAIGIDCFLGRDYHFYETTSFPRYITRRFGPEHLLATTMKGFIQYQFPPPSGQESFLSKMVYEGKVLYLLDRLLPATADSLKIGYTRQQMGWAENYERDIWAWFIENELLYSVVERDYNKYLDEAPFTTDLGPHSAPRVGAFSGWKIVRRYMEEHEEVTPAQLMETNQAQEILRASGYKPR